MICLIKLAKKVGKNGIGAKIRKISTSQHTNLPDK